MVEPIAIATRATKSEAREHFESGGAVLVTETNEGPTREVYPGTTLNRQGPQTWAGLTDAVETWRNRYPRQTFYIVPAY